ncbi:MAG: hypothetical protein O6945_00460 [Gammaproteobacteria bacterium]|nr:hypothetical protein [Gammaproteobacteria bacterium]
MITRRTLIKLSVSAPLLTIVPTSVLSKIGTDGGIKSAMRDSALIYLTPIQSNGDESSCQAEVWFVNDGIDMYVCTSSKSWRAQAPARGLNRARVWVGDLGSWKRNNGKYKQLPQVDAEATVVSDDAMTQKALDLFGDKYPVQWIVFESRFRNGLADGSRIMLRYRPFYPEAA